MKGDGNQGGEYMQLLELQGPCSLLDDLQNITDI